MTEERRRCKHITQGVPEVENLGNSQPSPSLVGKGTEGLGALGFVLTRSASTQAQAGARN
jgi:hypothetical protein